MSEHKVKTTVICSCCGSSNVLQTINNQYKCAQCDTSFAKFTKRKPVSNKWIAWLVLGLCIAYMVFFGLIPMFGWLVKLILDTN